MISFYDDDIDVEYTYIPATGDGWHEEKFGEYVEIDAVYRDGEEITCELTDEEFDALASEILAILRHNDDAERYDDDISWY
jgi:hypothetical protein